MKLLLLCVGLALTAASPIDTDPGSTCRCVPNQWTGVLSSTEREFDLSGGRSNLARSDVLVYYDYARKRFAMVDLETGSRAIADYQAGFKYLIRDGRCHGIKTDEAMKRMCLPDNAQYMGMRVLGANIPVVNWQFSGPFNISLKTTVVQKNCVPLSEEIYMAKEGFVSLTTSVYLDVALSIDNPGVFDPPPICLHDRLQNNIKRAVYGGDDVALLVPRMFKNKLYSFN